MDDESISVGENPTNINNLMFLICNLSESARQSAELETYRASALESDQSTDIFILQHLFADLMNDLKTLGISFNIDHSDLIDNTHDLLQFLELATYLFPSTLSEKIKHDDTLRTCLQRIVDGTLGDGEPVIKVYLSQLGGLDDETPLVPVLSDLIDQYYTYISQTDLFSDMLKNLLNLHSDVSLMVSSDTERHNAYRTKLTAFIVRLSQAVNTLENVEGYDAVCLIQRHVITDFLLPNNFIDYAYLMLENAETLPLSLVDAFNKKWYQYHVSHPWCYDYYAVRKVAPTFTQSMMLYCFLFAEQESVKEFKALCDKIPVEYRHATAYGQVVSLYEEDQS